MERNDSVKTDLKVRARLPEHRPPISLGPLPDIMHRHHSNITSPVGFFHVRLKGSSGGGNTVVDEDGGVLELFHNRDEGLQKFDAVFVGPIPKDVSQHIREDFIYRFDGLLFEHVALVEFDPLLQFWRQGFLALCEQGRRDVLHFKG